MSEISVANTTPPMTSTAAHAPLAVDIAGLHKSFGSNPVLKGVSITAQQGDVVALIGSSGSGKSTLLRCVNLLEIPDAGDVRIEGELIQMTKDRKGISRPADRRQVDRIRRRLGMVFQNFNLWTHRTVIENIIEAPVHVLGQPKAEAEERARALLAKVGLSERANHYPQQLSGGQQQRAAIARMLAMGPSVMLFDEPTSALDPELVGEVLKVIRGLADEGNTMLIVTHEMAFAREVASKVVFLHQGLVEEEGPPEKLFIDATSERCRQFLMREARA